MRAGLIVFAWLIAAALAPADELIRYHLSPVIKNGQLTALDIEFVFEGDADGETVLRLPRAWAGQRDLYQSVRDLTVTGAGVSVAPTEDPALRTVRHAPGATLTVRYNIVQYWDGVPSAGRHNEYRPIIQPTYFHILGETVFIRPQRDVPMKATFSRGGFPKRWTFASDIEHANRKPMRLRALIDSVAVGGDFRVLKQGPLRVAIRGAWPFKDKEFIGRLAPIIASHLNFWSDDPEPYLVTVLPLEAKPGSSSRGGTGLSDAFAFFATTDTEDTQLTRVLAHEHLHTWIPRRLGRMPDKDEAQDYWLSEGFTDFFAARLLIRDGGWTVEEFARVLNDVLRAYSSSPVKTAPNQRIIDDFWNDPNVGMLPYQRGQLLATLWDHRLRAATAGARDLDDVVLATHAEFKAAGADPRLASAAFVDHARAAGLDLAVDLARYLQNGEAVALPADVFEPCGPIVTSDVAVFDRGFDPEATAKNGNVVTGLREDSPAYRAGLRNGMKIVKRERGSPGDSRVELRYRVKDGDIERVIDYLPEGKDRFTLQEFKLRDDLDGPTRAVCAERLSGL